MVVGPGFLSETWASELRSCKGFDTVASSEWKTSPTQSVPSSCAESAVFDVVGAISASDDWNSSLFQFKIAGSLSLSQLIMQQL